MRTGVLDPAPPRAGADTGGRGGWVWLLTAGDVFEAELVRGLLENAGVPVVLDAFDRSPFAWLYPAGNVRRPVQVLVPASLLDVARLELLESSVVAADRLTAERDGVEDAPTRRLLRDRVRPVWFAVGLFTAITVGWFMVVEVLGFAPCEIRVTCAGSARDCRNAPALRAAPCPAR